MRETLPIRVRDGEIVPAFLGAADQPWLRELLELVEAHRGARWRELDTQLRRPVAAAASRPAQALAVQALGRLLRRRVRPGLVPRSARRTAFAQAALHADRPTALAAAAAELGVPLGVLEAALFADLPDERVVLPPAELPTPAELALQSNALLCRSLLMRAHAVELRLSGNARAVIRLARLRGLLCTVSQEPELVVQLSGPLSLFHHTTLYGRALGDLVPTLAWCRTFDLRAPCRLAGETATLRLRSGDPIAPAAEPRRFDSAVERRLARALVRRLPDHHVLREPEPVVAGRSLIFPDLAVEHRQDPARRWLIEIVGFWTPDYLARKLASYRAAALPRVILCIDETLACAAAELPPAAQVIRFKRSVDPEAVAALIERSGPPAGLARSP